MNNTMEILQRPFTGAECEQRKGPGGRMLTYVSHHAVVARLMEACGGPGGFNWVIDSVQMTEKMVCVTGTLIVSIAGEQCRNSGTSIEPLSGDLEKAVKTADTDALKRAARLFGVGLHLYDKSDDIHAQMGGGGRRVSGRAAPRASMGVGSGKAGPTEGQKRFLYVLAEKNNMSANEFADAILQLKGKAIKDMAVGEVSELLDWAKDANIGQELMKAGA